MPNSTDTNTGGSSGFAARLKFFREMRSLSHQELGAKIGKARTSIVQYEKEIDGISPPLSVIDDLARALDVSPAFLVYGVGGDGGDDPARYSFELGVFGVEGDGSLSKNSAASLPKWWITRRLLREEELDSVFFLKLDQAAPQFGFSKGDLALLGGRDTPITADNQIYAMQTEMGAIAVRYTLRLGDCGGDYAVTDGYGAIHTSRNAPALLGRVVGSLSS